MDQPLIPSSEDQMAHGARAVTPFNFEAAHDRARLVYLRDELLRLSKLAATAEHDANSSRVSGTLGDLANGLADDASDLTACIDRGDEGYDPYGGVRDPAIGVGRP